MRAGQQADLPVGAATMLMACCLLCVGCVVFFVYAAMVFIVVEASPAMSVACANEANIWMYCASMLIIVPVLSCCFGTLARFSQSQMTLQNVLLMIPNGVLIVTSVWGVLLWINMSKECHAFYDAAFPSLLWIFYVLVVVTLFAVGTACCCACVLLVAIISHVSGGGGGLPRFDEIPDEKPADDSYGGGYSGAPPENESGFNVNELQTEELV
mmetsp:Transcript_56275/g.115090  ORF Transcript_56275/g.115090 Transcript_56275/m.115090 type:complete len:212 (-) Transcript_56275:147-782(-)|eukprot:CAMPEP_0181324718 /NCGR_PEP_ID=MMETSP1101-20121128/20518_1 /TAXON_ID=46948 /ORGANISM="Rhodomonas abbreviata, Strain Caron Lab Isolate" /LENGTH=211 /DNA_ID=CAMNT_0023432931 /DNA_START=102 /DNA_END=737 /DNA_ORIENTATION=-